MREINFNPFDGEVWNVFRGDQAHVNLSEVMLLGEKTEALKHLGKTSGLAGKPSIERISKSEGAVGVLHEIATLLHSTTIDSAITSEVLELGRRLHQQYDPEDELTEKDAEELQQKAIAWKGILRQELEQEQRIPAGDTGLFDVQHLINSPRKLFSDIVWEWLDDRARSDIQEACKTLAINCSTSSVILSLRALEHCLRVWYVEEMGEELEAGWGQALGQLFTEFLENESSNDLMEQLGALPSVLSNLYYLKEKRNEVNHPEKSPSSQEARRTLMIVAATISEIHSEVVETESIEYEGMSIHIPLHVSEQVERLFLLIRGLNSVKDGGHPPLKSEIRDLASQLGIQENDIEDLIDELMMSGRAYEPQRNAIRTI